MLGRRSGFMLLALLLALLLQGGPQCARGQGGAEPLASDNFAHSYAGGEVSLDTAISLSGRLAPGQVVTLELYLDSAISPAAGMQDAQAAMLNGAVYVGLPPGLDPAGKLRISYFNPDSGKYEYAYSSDYAKARSMSQLGPAQADAQSGDPQKVLSGLGTLSRAFDPALKVSGPADPRLSGEDRSYSISGISWLLPCNVAFKPLVDPFDPAESLQQQTRLKIAVPIKVSSPSLGQPVMVYAAGLSIGVVKTELPADQIPANAYPLAPLPEPKADAGAEAAGAQKTDTAADSGGEEDDGARPAQRGRGNARADKGKKEEAEPAPPAPVPVLLYGCRWAHWELAVTLDEALAPEKLRSDPENLLPPLPGLSPAADIEPYQDRPASAGNSSAGAATEPGESPTSLDELLAAADGGGQEQDAAASAGAEDSAEAESSASDSTDVGSAAEDSQAEDSGADGAGAREVEPGTISAGPSEYRVALKPISGFDPDTYVQSGSSVYQPAGGPARSNSGRYPGAGAYSGGAELSEMLLVAGGEFLMGTPDKQIGDKDEKPQHKVSLPDFYIDKYPVTNRQFYSFVLAAGYKPEGNWDKYYSPETADLPVMAVSWADANAFARWAGKRLPTEAEWEKAARGSDGRTYPWGEDWSGTILPRSDDNIFEVVGARDNVSPCGAVDMVGVIWQWTSSSYTPTYPYDPRAGGDKKVLRGGAYSNGRNIVRCANRYAESPNVALATFGFRCARDSK
ncbi:SUMF1/EgtB/PvdO family nonheme iron enzyme [bacterium]|nr:SUMF1/EgtB/PvdO family nonheme iron enzyme [bacterium]